MRKLKIETHIKSAEIPWEMKGRNKKFWGELWDETLDRLAAEAAATAAETPKEVQP